MQRGSASLPLSLLLALSIAPAGAQTFYNEDGVQLSATVRVIHPGAATCRIREERHTAEQYERLKPNGGQPLNVWRVELVVANYSGKALDYLSAHLNVTSDWPPCDHWDGPEGRYGAPVVWTGPLMSIQDVGTVEPGEEVRESVFVLAWHEEEPTLGRWDINYDFVVAPGGGAAETRPESAGTGRATAAAEPPFAEGGGLPAGIRPEDTCAGKTVGASCWLEVANQPGCYTWDNDLGTNETVSWSGGCPDGLAHGRGQYVWDYTDVAGQHRQGTANGEMRRGKQHGRWTARFSSGTVFEEANFVDGALHGRSIMRLSSGTVLDGHLLDGQWHGRRTRRDAEGNVSYTCFDSGAYVDCP